MKKLNYIVVVLFILVSCQGENKVIPEGNEHGKYPFSLRSFIEQTTRVSGTSWEVGDQIGVYLHDYDTPTAIYYSNLRFITNQSGVIGEFVPSSGAVRFDDLHYKLVAYYPFTNTPSSTVNLDVSDQSNVQPFLVANSSFDKHTQFPLNIIFKYVYSKVIFRIYPKSGNIDDLQNISSVDLVYIPLEGNYQLASQTFTSTSNKSTLHLSIYNIFDEYTYAMIGKKAEALLIPFGLDNSQVLIDFGAYRYMVPIQDSAWEQGKCYIYNISLDPYNPDEMEVSTGEVFDWLDGNPNDDNLVPV